MQLVVEPQTRGEPPIRSGQAGAFDRAQTIARIRVIRAEHARAAAFYANRVERARAAARYGEMERWTIEYRRVAARCRLLGEVIRKAHELA